MGWWQLVFGVVGAVGVDGCLSVTTLKVLTLNFGSYRGNSRRFPSCRNNAAMCCPCRCVRHSMILNGSRGHSGASSGGRMLCVMSAVNKTCGKGGVALGMSISGSLYSGLCFRSKIAPMGPVPDGCCAVPAGAITCGKGLRKHLRIGLRSTFFTSPSYTGGACMVPIYVGRVIKTSRVLSNSPFITNAAPIHASTST